MSGFFVHTRLPTLAGGVAQKIGAFGSQKVRPGVLFRFFRIERVCAAGAVSRNDLSLVEAQVFDSPIRVAERRRSAMSFSLARAARKSVDPFCASGGLFKIEQFAVRPRVKC
jgi:hypothetical protein